MFKDKASLKLKKYIVFCSAWICSPHSYHAFVTGSIPIFSAVFSLKDSQQLAVTK